MSMKFEDLPEKVTVAEAAEYLRIPASSLHYLCRTGKVKAEKWGKHWRFNRSDLNSVLATPDAEEAVAAEKAKLRALDERLKLLTERLQAARDELRAAEAEATR